MNEGHWHVGARWGVLAAMGLIAGAAIEARACSVPVFRYALERWPADRYEAIVFSPGPLAPDGSPALKRLHEAAETGGTPANLILQVVNTSQPQEMSENLKQIWRIHETRAGQSREPWLVVRYPIDYAIDEDVWAGPLTEETVEQILNSPIRAEMARRLLSGDSAVFLLVESGDKAKDDEVAAMLADELKRLAKELQLPAVEEDDRRYVSDEGPELKLALSMVRVGREDPRERLLLRIILGDPNAKRSDRSAEPKDADKSPEKPEVSENAATGPEKPAEQAKAAAKPEKPGPVVVPVFGRSRALTVLGGEDLRPATIEDVAAFLTGPCSCQVKTGQTGIDLLVSADWDGVLTGQSTLNEALPRLTSAAALAEAKAVMAPPVAETIAAVIPAASGEAAPAETQAAMANPLVRNLLIVAAAGLCLVLAIVAKMYIGRIRTEGAP